MTCEVKFLIGVQVETAHPSGQAAPAERDQRGITGGSFCSPRHGIAFAISVFRCTGSCGTSSELLTSR